MANLNAGDLNRRIQIQTKSTQQNAYGEQLPVWTTAYQCWASIDVQASALIYSTAEFVSKVTHRIECRWTSSFAFAQNQRIVYVEPITAITHTYNIEAVLNDKQGNRKIILLCYELNGSE